MIFIERMWNAQMKKKDSTSTYTHMHAHTLTTIKTRGALLTRAFRFGQCFLRAFTRSDICMLAMGFLLGCTFRYNTNYLDRLQAAYIRTHMHMCLILFITEMLQFLWFRLIFFLLFIFYGFPLLSPQFVWRKNLRRVCLDLFHLFDVDSLSLSSFPLALALSHPMENKPPHFFTVIPTCFYHCDHLCMYDVRIFFILYNSLHTIHRAHLKHNNKYWWPKFG